MGNNFSKDTQTDSIKLQQCPSIYQPPNEGEDGFRQKSLQCNLSIQNTSFSHKITDDYSKKKCHKKKRNGEKLSKRYENTRPAVQPAHIGDEVDSTVNPGLVTLQSIVLQIISDIKIYIIMFELNFPILIVFLLSSPIKHLTIIELHSKFGTAIIDTPGDWIVGCQLVWNKNMNSGSDRENTAFPVLLAEVYEIEHLLLNMFLLQYWNKYMNSGSDRENTAFPVLSAEVYEIEHVLLNTLLLQYWNKYGLYNETLHNQLDINAIQSLSIIGVPNISIIDDILQFLDDTIRKYHYRSGDPQNLCLIDWSVLTILNKTSLPASGLNSKSREKTQFNRAYFRNLNRLVDERRRQRDIITPVYFEDASNDTAHKQRTKIETNQEWEIHTWEMLAETEGDYHIIPEFVSNLNEMETVQTRNNLTIKSLAPSHIELGNNSGKIVDVIFYYLMSGEEPDECTYKNLKQHWEPLLSNANWFELCCWMLDDHVIFKLFIDRLSDGKRSKRIQDLFYQSPGLLHNRWSILLIERLKEYTSFATLTNLFLTIRDINGRTCMFFKPDWYDNIIVELYSNHIDDLYELLSIQDSDGQTALHVNTEFMTYVLLDTYTPKYRHHLLKLLTIKDNNKKTAIDTAEKTLVYGLASMAEQVVNNHYLITQPEILLIYNTTNRPGSEEEALSIFKSFKSLNLTQRKLEKDKTHNDILQLITKTTQKIDQYGNPPTALVVVLMSHGNLGAIFDKDLYPISLTTIEAAMCSNDQLKNRPKILITQCCQHRDDMSEYLNSNPEIRRSKDNPRLPSISQLSRRVPYTPTHSDFCAIMSSVCGEQSERNVFIPKLAEQIRRCRQEDSLFDLVTSVSQQIESEGSSQTPIIMSTLTSKLCLPSFTHARTPRLYTVCKRQDTNCKMI